MKIKINDYDKILFIGDSITDIKFNRGHHRAIGGKYVHCLQTAKKLKEKRKGLRFFYKGIASNRSYHIYDRLTKDCISLNPDVIVLLIGVNDAWEHYVPDQYAPLLRPFEPHMREVFRRIKTELPKAKLLVLLPFMIDTLEEKLPFHTILNEYRDSLRSYAEDTADSIIDLQAVFSEAQKQCAPSALSRDNIHPTNLGHSFISNAVCGEMDYEY